MRTVLTEWHCDEVFSQMLQKLPVSMFPLIFQTHSFITDYLISPITSITKQRFKEVVTLLKHDTDA